MVVEGAKIKGEKGKEHLVLTDEQLEVVTREMKNDLERVGADLIGKIGDLKKERDFEADIKEKKEIIERIKDLETIKIVREFARALDEGMDEEDLKRLLKGFYQHTLGIDVKDMEMDIGTSGSHIKLSDAMGRFYNLLRLWHDRKITVGYLPGPEDKGQYASSELPLSEFFSEPNALIGQVRKLRRGAFRGFEDVCLSIRTDKGEEGCTCNPKSNERPFRTWK